MAKKTAGTSEPKFPYTTEPKALRRLLSEIPNRPKPIKVTMDTLKSWSVSNNNNARTAIAVLKKLGLLNGNGEPTPSYIEFMKTGSGPSILGEKIKDVYRELFENSIAPQKETDEELKKLFNIHSGGGADAMRLQIQTFKALSEHASFDGNTESGSSVADTLGKQNGVNTGPDNQRLPPVRVDLHIHLPENKSTRDYEAIIQDIGRYIYGRNIDDN